MNVYVETNFVFELALLQEQYQSCEDILSLCEAGAAKLVLPAYCLVEPYDTLTRRHRNRKRLKTELDAELKQLARTASYTQQITTGQDMLGLLRRSTDEEWNRLEDTRTRMLKVAEIIPLTPEILESAAQHQSTHDLSPQDAIVYASVLNHIRYNRTGSCFLNKNSRDFDDPDIVETLKRHNCKMLPRFDHGYQFLRSKAHSQKSAG